MDCEEKLDGEVLVGIASGIRLGCDRIDFRLLEGRQIVESRVRNVSGRRSLNVYINV